LNTQLLDWTRSHSIEGQSNAGFLDMTLSWDIQLTLGLAGFRNDLTNWGKANENSWNKPAYK